MTGRLLPYLAATVTAAGLTAGGLVLAASVESPTVVLPQFPDDPELVWDIRVDDAEWAVGDTEVVYVAAPVALDDDRTTMTVWDRTTGEFVREFETKRPAGEDAYFTAIVDDVLLAERCTVVEPGPRCELVATDVTRSRTLWSRNTSSSDIGLVDGWVVLTKHSDSGDSELRLVGLRTGEQQMAVAGDEIHYESLRSEFSVRSGQDIEAFRLPDLEQPIVSAQLPYGRAVQDVVGDELVVGSGRTLFVTRDGALAELQTFSSDIEYVYAASDELVLVGTDDGVTSAIDVSSRGGRSAIWTDEAYFVTGWVGPSGSAALAWDGETTITFLDQTTGDPIEDSDGWWHHADGGIVLSESERVWGFGYDEQDLVWSVDGLGDNATLDLVDRGFVIIGPDGTVRLYQ